MQDKQNPGTSQDEPKNRSRYILLNTLSSYGRDFVDILAFLVLIPFIIKTIGKESFGLWSLLWSFLGIFELADLGFAASVIKYVADARGKKDEVRLQKIVCTLFWIYVLLGALVFSGVCSSLLFFNRIFEIPAEQTKLANTVLMILGVRTALYLPLGMFRGVLVGYQKMMVANVYKASANLLYLVAVLIFLSVSPDIRVLATINAITGLLPMFAMMLHVKKIAPNLSIRPRFFERSYVRELTSFSLYFSLIQLSGMIASRSDALIIKLFLPLEYVGIYAIGMRLSESAGLFCSHLVRALTPVFAELHGAEDQSSLRATHYLGSKITTAFATPLLLGLGILAEPLIVAWTGPGFVTGAAVCQWLVGAAALGIIHGNSVNFLSMGGNQKYVAVCLFAGQVLNVLLSFILIKPLGIVGVSMATFLAAIPVYIGLIEVVASRKHGQSMLQFYWKTAVPSAIPALIMSALFLVILRFHHLTSLVEVAIVEAIGIVVFGVSFWVVGFNASERAYLKDKINKVVKRKK